VSNELKRVATIWRALGAVNPAVKGEQTMLVFQKKVLPLIVIASASIVGALSQPFAKKSVSTFSTTKQKNILQRPRPQGDRYVRSGSVAPQLRWNLRALGDRLERPGKEQETTSGILEVARAPHPALIEINTEFSNRIVMTLQAGGERRLITFDGTQESWSALSEEDRDLVETLLFDGPDNFFFGQASGLTTRFLGARFSETGDSTAGPFYDIYAVASNPSLTPTSAQGAKLFQFNSDSQLLEIVRYETERNGSRVAVEVRLSDWREIAGQRVPHHIERIENGMKVMTFNMNRVWFAPGVGAR